ncbi:hypothetical protein HaLaN_30051 [Haematococcus lacustris]|uniref:Uncharacterized protein n=1 Tax=Haematococcus lacustris TaxID=44745 RepID=A0A6A0AFL9_HAELA|nr:hypothetical protein HaLaN_30051 [Haematococcus lacustris]
MRKGVPAAARRVCWWTSSAPTTSAQHTATPVRLSLKSRLAPLRGCVQCSARQIKPVSEAKCT